MAQDAARSARWPTAGRSLRNRWRIPCKGVNQSHQARNAHMRLAGCPFLQRGPLLGTWFRAIQAKFWANALATSHTSTIPGRFNAGNASRPGFQILYVAEDQLVALFEVQALIGSPYPGSTYLPNPAAAWSIINVNVQLSHVADLTARAQRAIVQTTAQELTGDWRGYLLRNPHPNLRQPYWTNVPTQRLGSALFRIPKLEGFLTYSAKVATRRN